MIALDTNILVRYLVNDDRVQAKSVQALSEGLIANAVWEFSFLNRSKKWRTRRK